MGRLKKFKTEEELKIARREYSKKYYWKNKEKVDERVRENNQKRQGHRQQFTELESAAISVSGAH